MKRIFPLMLAVLLLAGCTGKPSTETSAETTAPQTEPTGIYTPDSQVEQQTSGAVRAYDITGTQLYAVDAGMAVLNAAGELTVIDTDEGLIQSTASKITDVLAVSGNSLFYYDGNICEYRLDTEEKGSWELPADMLGDYAIGTETREIYYCVSGEIHALNMDTGLARLLKQHSFEQQSILGAYFGGKVIAWETEAGITYLSSTDGSELRQEQGIHTLYTRGDSYMALRLDGIVEQVILGQLEQEAVELHVQAQSLVPVLSMNGVVSVDADQGLNLSFYDLSGGLKTAAVSIAGEQAYTAIAASDSFLWILTENALYRWDTSKSQITDETVYTGPVRTAENPDAEGMAQCQDRVSQMNKSYGVRIRIWEDAVSKTGENDLTMEYQVDAINQMLDALEPILAQFPQNFLRNTVETGWVRICLVRQVNGEAGFVRYWEDGDCYIAIALGADMRQAFLTSLGGAVDSHVLGNSRDLEYWEDMNPQGFAYAYDAQIPEENAQYIGKYFANEISMSYPSEDRAQIFYNAMLEGNEEMFKEPVLQKKLKTLCEGIREAYSLKKKTETFPWEQYLEESLAYVK